MAEHCPSCGAGEIVVKKFTLPFGDDGTQTVLDYYCPSCGRLETIGCREPGWQAAVARWERASTAADNHWTEAARKRGPIASKAFRVVVCEASDAISVKDFASREDAVAYANDAASETDDVPPIATVFDHGFQIVHSGRSWSWIKLQELSQARDFLLAKAVQSRDYDMFPAAPFIAAYEREGDAAARRKLCDTMWVLLSDGTDDEQAVAATFFSKIDAPNDLIERAVDLYLSRGLDASSAVARLLAGQTLSAAARTSLRAAFHADPIKHARFVLSPFVDSSDSSDWKCLLTIAEKTNDPELLGSVFTAALAHDRAAELTPILSKRPEPLVRAASRYTLAQEFLRAAGLSAQ